ncbi:uncharacterized protein LOC122035301 [Zingiber officinale]|uniref:uncharacterized protein LOC122035301 n=1 Tax=Zingiber officinale TaxID=94328 RepID=UPI001C4ABA1D|nr:uncharacterized protein LOC122035301 [Zingiber officinale]
MEVYLKTSFDQWFSITRSYKALVNNAGSPMDPEQWNPEMKKKAQIDFKALSTLQCGLTKEELNHVDPHENAKELWGKLIELHKGAIDAKEGKTTSQLHARIKDILKGLHNISNQMENCDLIRLRKELTFLQVPLKTSQEPNLNLKVSLTKTQETKNIW